MAWGTRLYVYSCTVGSAPVPSIQLSGCLSFHVRGKPLTVEVVGEGVRRGKLQRTKLSFFVNVLGLLEHEPRQLFTGQLVLGKLIKYTLIV